VVSLGEVGLITHQVPNEVSALSTFDFPFIQTLPGAMLSLDPFEKRSPASGRDCRMSSIQQTTTR